MELTKVVLYHVVVKLREVFETSFGRTIDRHCIIVRIEDSYGETGWGEVPVDDAPLYSYETVDTTLYVYREFFMPVLSKGRVIESPKDVQSKLSIFRGYRMAKAGLEFALWDLYSRSLRKPLYKVLGGVRDRVESGISIGVIGDLSALTKAVDKYLERGYRRVKVKVKPGWDLEPVKAIRKTFGEIPLMIDANASYTISYASIFKELDKYELLMIEQPLHYDDLYEHSVLQSMIKTPICLDESIKGLSDALTGARIGAMRVINVKPARVGGLHEAKLINDYMKELNVPIWIGGMLETGIGRGFQVAAATLDNVKYPNDISESSRYYEEELVEPPWTLNNDGTITVPSKPGIGVDVIEERVAKYSRKIIEFKL